MTASSTKLRRVAARTRAKRRLGAFLAQHRKATGRTGLSIAQELKLSDATLSRYESGEVLPAWATVLMLLGVYGAGPEDKKPAEELWDAAKDEPAPVRLPAGTPKSFRRLVNAEREGEQEWAMEPYTIPGLLQTEAYTRALVEAAYCFNDPVSRLETVIATRAGRQLRLEGADPLVVHTLIDEAAIMRVVGGADVMREQLEHLLTLSERPHVTLQVVPFDVSAYGTMSGPCIIIKYPEPEENPGVYLEYPAGGAWVDDVDDVRRFTTMFDAVAALALPPDSTVELIQRRIRALTER